MSILTSKKTEYEFSLDEMKKLIAADLGEAVENISVEYVKTDVSHNCFDYPRYEVTKIKVSVDQIKNHKITDED